MANSSKRLLIGSTEAYNGKSTTILGIIHKLSQQGITTACGKPIGNVSDDSVIAISDRNMAFLTDNLGLSIQQLQPPILNLNQAAIAKRLAAEDTEDYSQKLRDYVAQTDSEVVLLEGATTFWEGGLFEISMGEMAAAIDAPVLLVTRYDSLSLVANLLIAKKSLGNRLLGVVINNIPEADLATINEQIKPYLEKRHIAILGAIPQDRLLNSVSVRELSQRLNAKVLCCEDRLNLMVEGLTIGAMNVNSAIEYFRQKSNMVVVTGSDRRDLQMAALETLTNCLILTGHTPADPLILSRAEDLEIPILAVDSDTLTTVEIVDAAFGQVSINESIKVKRVIDLMADNFDFERLFKLLGIETPLTV